VLKNVSMRIRPGEYIGIVGPSGCGKSTLLKCMLGFEKPTQGKIYYDDKDIDTLDKSALRRQIGTVLQDGQLVMGTIMTNVTISAPDLTIDEVEEVLKEAGIYDDIQAMPMGVYTSVSEGSGSVSGGQKQRILIARALANNPRIVFFDEATSALDNITQQKVCENLANRNVTRIMIAHRLSTVRKCDRIIVMDHGEIKETGSYDELMAQRGLFYEFA
jgi:ATP-binding cassette subfamily C protein